MSRVAFWVGAWSRAHVGSLGTSVPASRWSRGLSAAVSEDVHQRLQALRQAMMDALELADSAGPSATQLMLETDPAARGPREQYELHYAELALGQLSAALDLHSQLRQRLGEEEAARLLRREKLAVTAAECQLARDRTQQIIAAAKRRQLRNEIMCDD